MHWNWEILNVEKKLKENGIIEKIFQVSYSSEYIWGGHVKMTAIYLTILISICLGFLPNCLQENVYGWFVYDLEAITPTIKDSNRQTEWLNTIFNFSVSKN